MLCTSAAFNHWKEFQSTKPKTAASIVAFTRCLLWEATPMLFASARAALPLQPLHSLPTNGVNVVYLHRNNRRIRWWKNEEAGAP